MANFVYFLNGLSEELESHYNEKECRLDVILQIEEKFYETYFFTPSALQYELTEAGYFSFPGLIILDEISYDKIITSLKALIAFGYFDCYTGYSELPANSAFIHKWYVNEMKYPYNDRVKVPLKD